MASENLGTNTGTSPSTSFPNSCTRGTYVESPADSKSDAGFAGCGFDSRALRLKFRSSNCLNTSGLRNQEPRFPRGFSRFLDMPPFRSPNDISIRFDTFYYRQRSLSGTWYGTNVGTFGVISAPIRAPFDAVKTGLETSRMGARLAAFRGSAGF
jgi:hypothetical protein